MPRRIEDYIEAAAGERRRPPVADDDERHEKANILVEEYLENVQLTRVQRSLKLQIRYDFFFKLIIQDFLICKISWQHKSEQKKKKKSANLLSAFATAFITFLVSSLFFGGRGSSK